MLNLKRCSLLFVMLLLPLLLIFSSANAQLTSFVSEDSEEITVNGVRISQLPWGQGPVNYIAGATATQRFPGEGSLEISFVGTGANGAFGSGTGYKALIQFWNDEQNYIAIGIIHDPGLTPWSGMTLMVEGAAYGQPVGGYWPADMPLDYESDFHQFAVVWTPTQLSFVIDYLTEHQITYNIKMNNPSFSILGAARMPGDAVSVSFEEIIFSFEDEAPPGFTALTWDK